MKLENSWKSKVGVADVTQALEMLYWPQLTSSSTLNTPSNPKLIISRSNYKKWKYRVHFAQKDSILKISPTRYLLINWYISFVILYIMQLLFSWYFIFLVDISLIYQWYITDILNYINLKTFKWYINDISIKNGDISFLQYLNDIYSNKYINDISAYNI